MSSPNELPFLDSCKDYLTADSQQKWSSSVYIDPTAGRRGTACAIVGGFDTMWRTFDDEYSEWWAGAAFKGAVGESPFVFSNALSGISASMPALGDGRFRIAANGAFGTGVTPPILMSEWYFLEFHAGVSPTGIDASIRINNKLVLEESIDFPSPLTGVMADHAKWSTLTLRGRSGGLPTNVEDIYVNQSGFYGDQYINVIHPNGPSTSGWTPDPAGNNWENVDDPTPDGDSTVVKSSNIDDSDLYTMESVPLGITIRAIQGSVTAKKSKAGNAAFKIQYGSGGSPSISVLSREFWPSAESYWAALDGREDLDGNALTPELLNSIHFGQKRTR